MNFSNCKPALRKLLYFFLYINYNVNFLLQYHSLQNYVKILRKRVFNSWEGNEMETSKIIHFQSVSIFTCNM